MRRRAAREAVGREVEQAVSETAGVAMAGAVRLRAEVGVEMAEAEVAAARAARVAVADKITNSGVGSCLHERSEPP